MPTFEPPTYPVEVPRHLTGGPRYRLHESNSVVRISGVLTIVKSPTSEQLEAAGVEGEDYFIGGRVYIITDATAAELETLGYSITALGYGESGYGLGPYGG